MTPPLAHTVADLFKHPKFEHSKDVVEDAFIVLRMGLLRDMERALAGKPEGPPGDKRLIQELKDDGPNGALRIYYTVVTRAVVVLCWGTKRRQQDDLDRARKMAKEVQARPEAFKLEAYRVV